ncbi:MAG: histidine kinase N-terminal 7TM domain-containing protein [Kineosporiaceae bacterium]
MSPSVLLAALLLVAALTYLALAAYVWRVRRAGGARALSLLLLAAGVWTVAYSHEIGAGSLAQAQRWSDLKYVGYCFIAPCLWAFVIGYTGTLAGRARVLVGALLVEPLVVLGLLASPRTRDWIHSYPDTLVLQQFVGGAPQPHTGPLYLPHMAYTFAVICAAVALLVRRLSRVSGPFRRPGRLMIGAALLPLVASILSNLGLLPASWPDPAAYLFLVTVVVLVWGFFRLRLVDLLPGAWQMVVSRMPDAVLVVDDDGLLLDTNPAADRLLGPRWGWAATSARPCRTWHPSSPSTSARGRRCTTSWCPRWP